MGWGKDPGRFTFSADYVTVGFALNEARKAGSEGHGLKSV